MSGSQVSGPAMATPESPTGRLPAPPYRPPGVSPMRIVGAILLTIAFFGLVALLPYYLEQYGRSLGLAVPVNPDFLLAAGAVVAVLAGLSVVTKPTRVWGPVRMLSAGFDLAYLLFLLQHPVYATAFQGFSITFTYGSILELFLIPPAIGLLAGVVTTIGDLRHPWERIQLQFPARGSTGRAYGQTT